MKATHYPPVADLFNDLEPEPARRWPLLKWKLHKKTESKPDVDFDSVVF